jgi:hypothetical protein
MIMNGTACTKGKGERPPPIGRMLYRSDLSSNNVGEVRGCLSVSRLTQLQFGVIRRTAVTAVEMRFRPRSSLRVRSLPCQQHRRRLCARTERTTHGDPRGGGSDWGVNCQTLATFVHAFRTAHQSASITRSFDAPRLRNRRNAFPSMVRDSDACLSSDRTRRPAPDFCRGHDSVSPAVSGAGQPRRVGGD